MNALTPTDPAKNSSLTPSLAKAFEPERRGLLSVLCNNDLNISQTVSEARRALDRAGQNFAQTTDDPNVLKTGLWLLEMVKSGAGVLDQGTRADIVWHEAPKPKSKSNGINTLFYGLATGLFVLALVDASRMGMMSVFVLTVLHALSGPHVKDLIYKLPFIKRPNVIEDMSGRSARAHAHLRANTQGFVDSLAEALRTADHVLMRLAEPARETHWKNDPRLIGFIQSLLEAAYAQDGEFALKLVGQELTSLLEADGIVPVVYSKANADMFDILPGIGQDAPKLAAPALMVDGQLVRRGTVWSPDHD